MSVPSINTIPMVPTNIDPRFRYGTRARPENFQQATSRFYLPPQRDSRFWPISYGDYDNECFDALVSKTALCHKDEDCESLLQNWCTDGQARYVQYECNAGKCVYDSDAY